MCPSAIHHFHRTCPWVKSFPDSTFVSHACTQNRRVDPNSTIESGYLASVASQMPFQRLAVKCFGNIEQLEHGRISDPVVPPLTLSAFLDNPSILEFSEVTRNGRLWSIEDNL